MSERTGNPWIRDFRASADAQGPALLLLPHAGGSAHGYSDWTDHVEPDIRLLAAQYPGRGPRYHEPLPGGIQEIVQPLVDALSGLGEPLHVFGHSMGALIGFELVWALEQRGRHVAAFFASACRAPHTANPRPVGSEHLSDDELAALLKLRGGTPNEVLENLEMREMVLDIVRRDFAIDDRYQFGAADRQLRCPIVAIGGDSDPAVPVENLTHWRELSESTAQIYTMKGGHFYFVEHMPTLMSIVHCALEHPRNLVRTPRK